MQLAAKRAKLVLPVPRMPKIRMDASRSHADAVTVIESDDAVGTEDSPKALGTVESIAVRLLAASSKTCTGLSCLCSVPFWHEDASELVLLCTALVMVLFLMSWNAGARLPALLQATRLSIYFCSSPVFSSVTREKARDYGAADRAT
jgi:hypothetical protein